MTAALALVNLALGLAYVFVGGLTVVDLRRGLRSRGFSHFGVALIALTFTCGPHHLVQAVHVGWEDQPARGLDLVAVVVGLPAGLAFLALRVEAFGGGAGDRFVRGTPSWLALAPIGAAVYLSSLIAVVRGAGTSFQVTAGSVPNAMLVVGYLAIAWVLLATQLANHRLTGGWSLSGLALTGVFATCAVMHAARVFYAATGDHASDGHGLVVGWLSVGAASYFLWVVRGMQRGWFPDWNGEMTGERRALEVPCPE